MRLSKDLIKKNYLLDGWYKYMVYHKLNLKNFVFGSIMRPWGIFVSYQEKKTLSHFLSQKTRKTSILALKHSIATVNDSSCFYVTACWKRCTLVCLNYYDFVSCCTKFKNILMNVIELSFAFTFWLTDHNTYIEMYLRDGGSTVL